MKQSRSKRERLYQRYRREKTQEKLIQWRRARAQHEDNVRMHKKDSWKQFVSRINVNTPVAKILQEDGRYYSTPIDIADKFAQTFAQISSTTNYDPDFFNFTR